MKPLHRPGEINFYEELGVASDASPEEIRDAFRSLARLLHPDQQTDGQLKETAERQMRKLNPIYAVLSDPERRRRYDEDIQDGYRPSIIVNAAPPKDFHRIAGRMVWIAAILLTGAVLLWLASDGTPSAQSRARVESLLDSPPALKSPASPVDSTSEMARLRSDLTAVAAQRDAALREINALREKPAAVRSGNPAPPRQVDRSSPIIAMTELPSPPRIPAVAPVPGKSDSPAFEPYRFEPERTEAGAPKHRLAGFWFYVKPAQGQKNTNQTLYPPEYIEAIITEENGVLHGKYRSRFQIVDRAISPDVDFSFTGTPNGSTVSCPWTGPGGARGELILRLISENSIKVDWNATELGSRQGLISGTAVLTRKLSPE